MATAYDYITIGGNQIRRPDSFAVQREDIYEGEYTTCTGKTVADRIGWKYSDMTLSWSALQQADVEKLIDLAGEVTLVFDDPMGDTISESVIRKSAVAMRHRYHDDDGYWWTDVSCDISFINAHTDDE